MGEVRGRPDQNPQGPDEGRITDLAGAYAAALLAGDEVAAEMVIREAMDASLSTAEIDDRLISPALWLVGDLWERGELSVAEEHIATEISIRIIALQHEARRVAAARKDRRVLLAAPSGEQHVVALRMVANLLRDAGYDIVMLGADVPAAELATATRRHHGAAVCLTTTMAGRRQEVRATIDEVRLACPDTGFVIGGRGLAGEAQLRAQVQVCDRVSEAVEAVDAAVMRAGAN